MAALHDRPPGARGDGHVYEGCYMRDPIVWFVSQSTYFCTYSITCTPQLPFKVPQIPTIRDHNNALIKGTLGGLGIDVCTYLGFDLPWTAVEWVNSWAS